MADEMETRISENGRGRVEAQGDAGSVKQHPLADQIAADRCLEAKKAAKSKTLRDSGDTN